MVIGPVDFLHIAQVRRRRIVAGRAGRLHRAVVHAIHREGSCTGMAQRTFVTGAAGRCGGRDMVGRFGSDAGVRAAMTALAGAGCHAAVAEGDRQPA